MGRVEGSAVAIRQGVRGFGIRGKNALYGGRFGAFKLAGGRVNGTRRKARRERKQWSMARVDDVGLSLESGARARSVPVA